MTQWEYLILTTDTGAWITSSELNDYGDLGWEVVQVHYTGKIEWVLLKRVKSM